MESSVEIDPFTEFFDAIKNPLTKDRYEHRLELFFDSMGIEGANLREKARAFSQKATKDTQWATFEINEYMRSQKLRAEKKEISESTIPNFFKPIKLFCEQNDIILNWKKISRRIPRGRAVANDRAPSPEEIRTILQYPDRRIKPVALVMESSGARLGSFDYLNYGHIEKIEKGGKLLAAKITIYSGTPDEYFSFITPECYHAIEEYVNFRRAQGEKITKDSPLIRDLFYPDRLGKGEPHLPKRLRSSGVKRLVEDALKGTGIRKPLEKGKKRHEFQADHGFRKFFKSAAEKHMKSLHVEMLMGHNIGLGANYYRPNSNELLEDYLKAIPDLTLIETVIQNLILEGDIESLKKLIESQNERIAKLEKDKNMINKF